MYLFFSFFDTVSAHFSQKFLTFITFYFWLLWHVFLHVVIVSYAMLVVSWNFVLYVPFPSISTKLAEDPKRFGVHWCGEEANFLLFLCFWVVFWSASSLILLRSLLSCLIAGWVNFVNLRNSGDLVWKIGSLALSSSPHSSRTFVSDLMGRNQRKQLLYGPWPVSSWIIQWSRQSDCVVGSSMIPKVPCQHALSF